MDRISRDQALMESALIWQKRSTCLRLQVGAIVAFDGRTLATGYNGAPKWRPHCTPDICGPDKPCERTVHAEANCIAFAARHGIALIGSVMYTTDSPCKECAKLIINAGIARIVYLRAYRDDQPLVYLAESCIVVERYRE